MYITKKHLSRRTVLKGAGATIALPLLDAMSPAATAWAQTAAGTAPTRLAFIGFPHGAVMDQWSPKQAGTDYEMSAILEPLAPYREHLTIVSGLRNKPAESPEPHGYIERTWLSCVAPWDAGVIGPEAGVTADQIAVRYIGQDTRLPSLELTTSQRGAQVAWRTPKQSLPQEGNPRAVFYKLFGQGDTDEERAAILTETGSILDRVKTQAGRLQASLGVGDRVVVGDYLDSVREIERRVQMASTQDMSHLDIPEAPVGIPNDLDEHMQLMFDLMGLAFQADLTRVITVSLDREASMRTYTNLAISKRFIRSRTTATIPTSRRSWSGYSAITPRSSRALWTGSRTRPKATARCSITRRSCSAATCQTATGTTTIRCRRPSSAARTAGSRAASI